MSHCDLYLYFYFCVCLIIDTYFQIYLKINCHFGLYRRRVDYRSMLPFEYIEITACHKKNACGLFIMLTSLSLIYRQSTALTGTWGGVVVKALRY